MDNQYQGPLKGGKHISVGGAQCTSGFVVNGAGGTYAVTAGHCGGNGSEVRLGGSVSHIQGNLQNNTYQGGVDAAVFSIGGDGSEPSVFVNSTLSRTVVSQAGAAVAPSLYGRACFRGSRTQQERCGNIITLNLPITNPEDGHSLSGMIEWQTDGAEAALPGDSGGPLYAVNADGTAVALGILYGGYNVEKNPNMAPSAFRLAYFTPIASALNATGTALKVDGRNPFGWIDLAQGGNGTVRVRGWALDPDKSRDPITVHVYVGGPAGSGEVHGFTANGYRPDVQSVYPNTGENHGIDVTFTTSRRGTIPVYLYGINAYQSGGDNALLWGNPLTVTVN
jgi:hypothetical protein